MPTYFNKNLKYIRKMKNMSQKELAKKIGVDQSTVSYWEQGMDVTIENALKVAEVLNVPFPEFLGTDMTISKNEYDDKLQKLATDNGVEISYSKNAPLTEEDFAQVSKILLEEIQKKEKK